MISIREIDKETYYNFWNYTDLHLLQSPQWAEIKSKEGWEIKLFGIYEHEELRDIFSIQIKKIGFIKFGYIPKTRLSRSYEALRGYFKKFLKLDFIIFEFDFKKDSELNLPSFLSNYGDHIQPEQTNIVKLNKSEDEFFMSLKGNYRRNIKKALREGLEIKIHTKGNESINMFYKVLCEVFLNTKFLPRPKKYFENVWNELSNSNKALIITAEFEGQVVGSYLVAFDNKHAYELYGGVTRMGRDHEAGYLLKWEAIKYFNSIGKISYDHWGVSKMNVDGTYQKGELFNISSFKEGFGGDYVEFYPNQVMVINKTNYNLFKLVRANNKALTKLRKFFKR